MLAPAWTPEREDYLRSRWGKVKTEQIAKELGGVTKNAIIGKARRLGLETLKKQDPDGTPKPPRVRRDAVFKLPKHKPRERIEGAPAPVSRAPRAIGPVTILQLNNNTCRWPMSEGGAVAQFYCGERPMEQLPYCFLHCKIAYQPPRPRR